MAHDPREILIAEDHRVSRYLLERTLQGFGYRVRAVDDGEAALSALDTPGAPQIGILDWRMPKLDGLEVCRQIKSRPLARFTYLILLSARASKGEISQGLEAGADDYIVKPFDSHELVARVRVGERVVRLRRQLSERISELESALATVKTLKKLVPICVHCKCVRDDQNYWHELEAYIHVATGTDFSHGICPDCLQKMHGAN
jgi:DNA-binding response OmpR family regulator